MKTTDSYFPRTQIPLVFFLLLALVTVQCRDGVLDSPIVGDERTSGTEPGRSLNGGSTAGSSLYAFNAPDGWKDLVIYAHGYVDPQEPLAIPDDQVEGVPVAAIVAQLGMAYATTSYPHNGLNGPEAVADVVNLVQAFVAQFGQPEFIYLVGVSEGALVTTLAVEQHPDVFSGGLAPCGPIGNFRRQLNYIGDFHVLFNYFYPGIAVGSPAGVDETIIDDWRNGNLKDEVSAAVAQHPGRAAKLLKVARVPVADAGNTAELQETFLDLLRFNVLATSDAIERLNGNPFDNTRRYYSGTGSFLGDWKLNRSVERFSADASALHTVETEFQTSGDLARPLVAMHTSGDQVIPYWHEPLYRLKAFKEGASLLHSNIPVLGRYGHCNFTLAELLTGFSLMAYKVSLQDLLVPSSMFESPAQQQEYLELSRKEGLSPVIRRVPEIAAAY